MRGWRARGGVIVFLAIILALAVACGGSSAKTAKRSAAATPRPQTAIQIATATPSASPTPTSSPTPTPSPSPTPTASPSATPSPTPTPQAPIETLSDGTHGYVVTSAATIHAAPTNSSPVVARLRYQQELTLRARVRGERYVVGDQTWAMAIQDWSNVWYQVDGGYVYSAWVWVPRPGEVLPSQLPAGNRWIDVDLATQTARLMIGDRVVYTAPVTTGKDGYDTPQGNWTIQYQVLDETMTSSQAGINDPREQYDVKHVLFTQYFDGLGDALHLNYWQPVSVFGNERTSHGCVGLYVQDAQYFWMFAEPGMRVRITRNGQISPPPARPAATTAPTPARTSTPAPAPTAAPTRPAPSTTATPTPQPASPAATQPAITVTPPAQQPTPPEQTPAPLATPRPALPGTLPGQTRPPGT